MSKVYFGSSQVKELDPARTLPGKLDTILEKLDISSQVKDKRVCIKMHLGGNVGYSTIHPVFVRRLVSFIKNAGGKPFVTEIDYFALSAYERGYSQETLGCPVVPAAGVSDKYYHTVPASFKNLTEFHIAGEVYDSEFLVVLSHAKGHGCSAFGGSIKNIAIVAMDGATRSAMHMVQHAETFWDPDKCTQYKDGCTKCLDVCRRKTMRFANDNKLHIGFHECDFCKQCNEVCPTGALQLTDVHADDFQKVMALAAKAVLEQFGDNAVHINFATNITQFCDCMSLTTPNLVPDVGIFGSRDIVAVEQATLDSIDHSKLIPGSVVETYPMLDVEGHLFKKLHGKDPYVQVRAAEELGLGSTSYEIEEV